MGKGFPDNFRGSPEAQQVARSILRARMYDLHIQMEEVFREMLRLDREAVDSLMADRYGGLPYPALKAGVNKVFEVNARWSELKLNCGRIGKGIKAAVDEAIELGLSREEVRDIAFHADRLGPPARN